jgi:uncharacterized membrane protein
MPEETTEKKTDSVEMTATQKDAVAKAKGSVGNKILWWTLGILGVVIVIVTVVLIFLPKQDDKNTIERIIEKTKKETDRADIEAKITVAKAEGVADEKIRELKKTMEIEDTNERRKKLAEML